MLIIPGSIISLLTFPGVIVHEIAHRFFCDITKVSVYDVCYFRFGNPAGYVIHARPNNLKKSFFITVGPLIINTILCALLTFLPALLVFLGDDNQNLLFLIFAWPGISIGMHAFPSGDDVKNFVAEVKEKRGEGPIYWLLYFLSLIFLVLIKIANALRIVWFDLIYAVGISMLLPWLLVGF